MMNKKFIAGFVVFSLGASQGAMAQVAASAVPQLHLLDYAIDMDGANTPLVIPVRGGGESHGGGFGGGFGGNSGSERTFSAPRAEPRFEAPRAEPRFETPRVETPRATEEIRTPRTDTRLNLNTGTIKQDEITRKGNVETKTERLDGSSTEKHLNTETGVVKENKVTREGNEVTKTERPNGSSFERKTNPLTGESKTTTVHASGAVTKTNTETDLFGRKTTTTQHSNGAITVRQPNGVTVHTSPTGRVTTETVENRFGGSRVVIREVNHVKVEYNYGSRGYRGHNYYYYTPRWLAFDEGFIFGAAWAGYAYNVDRWGWSVNPWYNYYAGYFTPYPFYSNPWLWVTDAYIADLLAQRYADTVTDEQQQAQLAPLSPEVKDQIAEQVHQEMDNYKNQQPLTLDSTLQPGHIFTVHQDMAELDMDSGNQLNLSAGDLIKFVEVSGDETATLQVVSSESADAGARFQMSFEDIQKMNDKFVQDTETAMQKMQDAKNNGQLR